MQLQNYLVQKTAKYTLFFFTNKANLHSKFSIVKG